MPESLKSIEQAFWDTYINQQSQKMRTISGITKKDIEKYDNQIMYIKDDNEWQKEKAVVKEKLSQAIKSISRKSISSLLDWKQNNPEYENIDSEFSNKCIVIQQHSTAGNKQDIYYPKVIHNLAKENTI